MDRAEAVRKLVPIFRRYGYEGATLGRISAATELGKASLYHHFPKGKKEMATAVLDYANQWFQAHVLAPLQQEGEPSDRLQAMSASLNQFYGCGRDACLLALFSLGDADDLFHRQVQQALEAWLDALTQVSIEAGVPAAEAGQRAEDAVMQIQGALVLTRGLNDTSAFERVLRLLPATLLSSEDG
jgi:AcrR family transcriptional regulator